MTENKYTFTADQLISLMSGTVEMFREYMNTHGYESEQAVAAASLEMLEGLDAEQALFDNGELGREQLTQVYTHKANEIAAVRRGLDAFA